MDDAAQLAVPRGLRPRRHHRHDCRGRALPRRRPARDDRAEGASRESLRSRRARAQSRSPISLRLGLQADVEEAWLAAFAKGLARGSGRGSGSACSAATRFPWRPGRLSSRHRLRLRPEGADGASLRRPGRRRALRVRHHRRGRGRARAAEGRAGPVERPAAGGARGADPALSRARAADGAGAGDLLDFASAAMDVSDGLVGDCDKLVAASGCSARDRGCERAAAARP